MFANYVANVFIWHLTWSWSWYHYSCSIVFFLIYLPIHEWLIFMGHLGTLPKTNIAMENPPFWWNLQGNIGIFMGYVSFREGKYTVRPMDAKRAINHHGCCVPRPRANSDMHPSHHGFFLSTVVCEISRRGVIKWDLFWGGITQCKYFLILREFRCNSALFGLVI